MADSLELVTLGMFIIDEIEYITGKLPEQSLIGGAGTYVAIGARLVAGHGHSGRIGWIVDKGLDFPDSFETTINSWGTRARYRSDPSRLTTRAWNGYGPGEHRAFKYLTPKIRLDENSLSDEQLLANAFHMVCSPSRCRSLVEGIRQERRALKTIPDPRIIWEPVPELCVPAEIWNFRDTIQAVDVVSPNSEELEGFFTGEALMSRSEIAELILNWGIGTRGDGALVVREGKEGCTVYTRSWSCHFPAFHTQALSFKVKDPTGGGNAFLGGLAMALSRQVQPDMGVVELGLKDTISPLNAVGKSCSTLFCAMIYALIAASYVIEQAGMPLLEEGFADRWNKECFTDRIAAYVEREKKHIGKHLQIK